MPDISIECLRKSFGSERALDGVSFTANDGELLTLLGPSGCGKTTTLMSIAGFQHPDEGTINVGTRTFLDTARRIDLPAEDRNLGIVFQSYAIWPHMTVAQNVSFPLKVRKRPRAEIRSRVRQTLELVEMGPYTDRYPHELSGGQQQRVALARALVYSPSVLLLDEPFSNLDAKLRERARTWLRHLQSELALTTVFVTHDQDEALSMSDRILVMDGGRILQAGTPEEVYERPTSRFVAEFLGQCNIVVGRRSEPSEPSAAAVRVGDGTMELLLAEEPATADGMVECAIRPESIVISESMEVSQPNWFMADVLAVSFLGDHYLYELRIGDLELIGKSSHRILGARVAVYVSPEACRPLNRLETGNATTNLPEVATT